MTNMTNMTNTNNTNSVNKTSRYINGSPIYYTITVSGTPSDLENGYYYGEVYYIHPKTGKKELVWFSHYYTSSILAYAECHEKMWQYIEANPVIDS